MTGCLYCSATMLGLKNCERWYMEAIGLLGIATIVLLAPGVLVFGGKLRRAPYKTSYVPLVSLALYAVVCIASDVVARGLHIRIPGQGIVAISWVLAAMLGIYGMLCKKSIDPSRFVVSLVTWPQIAGLVSIAMLITATVFIVQLSSLNAFMQALDNSWHFNVVRHMVNSSEFSLIHPTIFDAGVPNPGVSFSFYPALWHALVAMLVQITGVSVAAATNAINIVTVAVLYPLSAVALFSVLFPRIRFNGVAAAAALCISVAFPWQFLTFGPLYPNLLGMALLPAGIALVYSALSDVFEKIWRPQGILAAFGSLVLLMLIHPNTSFTLAVYCAPYLVVKTVDCIVPKTDSRTLANRMARCIAGIGVITILACLWVLVWILPPIRSVVTFDWPPVYGKIEGLGALASSAYRTGHAQWLISAMILAGVGTLLYKKKKQSGIAQPMGWIVAAFVFSCAQTYVTLCFHGFAEAIAHAQQIGTGLSAHIFTAIGKALLAGFWYTDPFRLSAQTALFAMPLIYVACAELPTLVLRSRHATDYGYRKHCPEKGDPLGEKRQRWKEQLPSTVVAAAALIVTFGTSALPSMNTAFSNYISQVQSAYAMSDASNVNERDMLFLEQVKALVGDAPVINNPIDGSSYAAYPLYGIETYYKQINNFPNDAETPESKAIRLHLAEAQTNTDVQSALTQTGYMYVLKLADTSTFGEEKEVPYGSNIELYKGILDIQPDTPGFRLLLQDGPRQLYVVEQGAR